MAGTQRAAYDAGRVDERNEIAAWLRLTQHADRAGARLADLIEQGVHLEASVLGLEATAAD